MNACNLAATHANSTDDAMLTKMNGINLNWDDGTSSCLLGQCILNEYRGPIIDINNGIKLNRIGFNVHQVDSKSIGNKLRLSNNNENNKRLVDCVGGAGSSSSQVRPIN